MIKFKEGRLNREAEFFNEEYSRFSDQNFVIQETMFRKYQNPRNSPIDWREWAAVCMGSLQDKIVLDYGCGMGEESVYFAKLGARVYSIDISPSGIEVTKRRAKINGVEDRICAQTMNAMATDFESETFDIIHGIGILHHLDVDAAIEEIWRLLKKGGKAVFLEPVDNSLLMRSLKEIIPVKKLDVTDDEKSFVYSDIKRIGAKFDKYRYWEFFFLARLRKLIRNERTIDFLKKSDFYIFKYLNFCKHYASGVVIELIK